MNKKRPTVLEWAVQEGIPCPALTIQQQAEEIARLQGESAALRQALEDYSQIGDCLRMYYQDGDTVALAHANKRFEQMRQALESDAAAKEAAVIEAAKEWRESRRLHFSNDGWSPQTGERFDKALDALAIAVEALLGNEP